MIRINLLPTRQTERQRQFQQQILVSGAVILVALTACILWSAAVESKLKERQKSIAEVKGEIVRLDKIIGEVNEYTTKKQELEKQLKVIDDLKKGKTGPVRAMDDLAREIPNRVWLTELTEKSGSVTIEGKAIDPEDVSAFMKSLEKSRHFSSVVLMYSKSLASKGEDVPVYEFSIKCTVNYAA
jgi:type IV pilus assembly protein PilN